MSKLEDMDTEIIVLCIGSSKIFGDSLGPRTAEKLTLVNNDCIIYGNMRQSINGNNLAGYVSMLRIKHPDAVIVAVDACLTTHAEDIGLVKLLPYGVNAGKAVKRNALPVGEFSVIGIVGEYNSDVYATLNAVSPTLMNELVEKAAILTSLAVKKLKNGMTIAETIV